MARLLSLAAAVASALCLLAAVPVQASPAKGQTAPRCFEDEACWRWSTMGNLDRGVYVHGRRAIRVVSPCRFAAMDFHGRIDWTRTPRLRGDGFARRHGCNPRLYA